MQRFDTCMAALLCWIPLYVEHHLENTHNTFTSHVQYEEKTIKRLRIL
jgi:hypothetical protein